MHTTGAPDILEPQFLRAGIAIQDYRKGGKVPRDSCCDAAGCALRCCCLLRLPEMVACDVVQHTQAWMCGHMVT